MKTNKSIKSIIVIALIVIIAGIMFLNSSLAANTAKVTVETANLRENASSDSKILDQISEGEEVEVISQEGDWYSVKYKDMTGYLNKTLLDTSNISTNTSNENNVKVENTEQNNTTNNTISEIANTTVNTTITSTTNETTKDVATETNYVVSETTNLKAIPLINSVNMSEIKEGTQVLSLQVKNGWTYVETNLTKGWIRSNLLNISDNVNTTSENSQTETALKTAYILSESVNLRNEASTDSDVVLTLTQNSAVEVLSEDGEWSKCRVSGNIGYIKTEYLSDQRIEATTRGLTESRESENSNSDDVLPITDVTSSSSNLGSSIVSTAMNYIGCSYVSGGNGPTAFDCSGFTKYIYSQFGISISRTSESQYSNDGVSVAKSELQLGDLVMFKSSKSSVGHVGIYIGDGKIVHAASASRGVTTDTINSGYYCNNYVGAKRIV